MWEVYVEKGISVFPVTPLTKTPEVKWTEYRSRMPKKEEIEKWKAGNYNIGLVCGQASKNLVVVDFDNPELFELVFPKIKGSTWVVKTPRPGIHVYFRTDKPIRGRNYNFAKIQVKGDGGYVLAPPSIHPNGNRYEFMEKCSPTDCDIAVVKAENFFQTLENKLRELGFHTEYKEDVSEGEELTAGDPAWVRKMLEGVPEGMRDECAIRLASYYCNVKHMAPQAVEAILLNWNTRNQPPVEDAENWAKVKVSSALRGGYVYTVNDPLIRQFAEVEMDKEVEDIISSIMKSNAVGFVVNHVSGRVKYDLDAARLLLLAAGTSFTKNPVNVFVRGPPSIGKTYVTRNVVRYFPNAILLMGMSPKTIVHEYSSYSKEEDAYIVDLWHKILIFLEEPSQQVYEILRPLMSHDNETVVYKWVEQKKNRQKTMKAILRGWPVFIFLGTTAKLLEDLASRGIHITPIMSGDKWVAAVKLKGDLYSKPYTFIDEDDKTFQAIREYLKRTMEYSMTKQLSVVIPFANKIVEKIASLPISKMPRAARDVSMLFDLIAGSCVLNVFNRMVLRVKGLNRWYNYLVATKEDLLNVVGIWIESLPASIAGVSQTQYELYKLMKEIVMDVELTVKMVYTKWNERFPDKPLSSETIRKYLNVLEDRGLIVSDKNSSGKLYYIPMEQVTMKTELLKNEIDFGEEDLATWVNSLEGSEIYFVVDNVVFDAKKLTDQQKKLVLSRIIGDGLWNP